MSQGAAQGSALSIFMGESTALHFESETSHGGLIGSRNEHVLVSLFQTFSFLQDWKSRSQRRMRFFCMLRLGIWQEAMHMGDARNPA